MKPRLIVIGASAGGIEALRTLCSRFRPELKTPIVVVQHLPAGSKFKFELIFSGCYNGRVVEARDKMALEPGHIYFAPASYHLLIEKNKTLALSQDEPVNYSRPSIDVTFESAAWAFGARACGVLLTGSNEDGARGLRTLADAGAVTLVQDPKTAEMSMMPQSALDLMKPTRVGSLEELADYINTWLVPEVAHAEE